MGVPLDIISYYLHFHELSELCRHELKTIQEGSHWLRQYQWLQWTANLTDCRWNSSKTTIRSCPDSVCQTGDSIGFTTFYGKIGNMTCRAQPGYNPSPCPETRDMPCSPGPPGRFPEDSVDRLVKRLPHWMRAVSKCTEIPTFSLDLGPLKFQVFGANHWEGTSCWKSAHHAHCLHDLLWCIRGIENCIETHGVWLVGSQLQVACSCGP